MEQFGKGDLRVTGQRVERGPPPVADNYCDPATMPPLITRRYENGYYVLGWDTTERTGTAVSARESWIASLIAVSVVTGAVGWTMGR
jgi:hypothetical protein